VILNPGIVATIVAVEDDAFHVRVDEKTKLKVLKTAVAGLQSPPPEMEKK
jgi:preprotein translocase subunit YajC